MNLCLIVLVEFDLYLKSVFFVFIFSIYIYNISMSLIILALFVS